MMNIPPLLQTTADPLPPFPDSTDLPTMPPLLPTMAPPVTTAFNPEPIYTTPATFFTTEMQFPAETMPFPQAPTTSDYLYTTDRSPTVRPTIGQQPVYSTERYYVPQTTQPSFTPPVQQPLKGSGGNPEEDYREFVIAFMGWRKNVFTHWIDTARQYKEFVLQNHNYHPCLCVFFWVIFFAFFDFFHTKYKS